MYYRLSRVEKKKDTGNNEILNECGIESCIRPGSAILRKPDRNLRLGRSGCQ